MREQRARLLLESFASIANVCYAEERALMRVDGIGEVQARRIFNVLHGISALGPPLRIDQTEAPQGVDEEAD